MQSFRPEDESRHADVAVEAWWWWGWNVQATAAVYVGLELRGRRLDYWAGLMRADQPYLYLEELNGVGLRDGLEIKPAEMWADHQCDVPFQQWSLGNEGHGVLLDDPDDAWRLAYGIPVPVTFDIEWHASDTATPTEHGYQQTGEVDVHIELTEGLLQFVGPARRVHVWGAPYLPRALALPVVDDGMRGPYRRHDGILVDQVCSRAGVLAAVRGTMK